MVTWNDEFDDLNSGTEKRGNLFPSKSNKVRERGARIIAVGDSDPMDYKTNVHKILMSSRVHCFKKQNDS